MERRGKSSEPRHCRMADKNGPANHALFVGTRGTGVVRGDGTVFF